MLFVWPLSQRTRYAPEDDFDIENLHILSTLF